LSSPILVPVLSEQPPVPRQLPLDVRNFTGRAEHLAMLDALLPAVHQDGATAGAVVISALDGTAGVGKTALAVHWAHRVQHHFPDGTLHVNLRGYGPGEPAAPGAVLDGFLRALGTPPQAIPIDIEAQAGLYRSLLADRRMLIVLDNANAAEQVRPLLPGSRTSLVLVTSRASLTGLMAGEAATLRTLDLLSPQEAVDLVREIVGGRRAAAEPDAVTGLTEVCARLPLALRIAASRIATRPHLRIADVLAEMADARGLLDVLSPPSDEAMAVRAVFGWSYQKLTTEQARLFRLLGLHPGPEISVHAAAAVAELPVQGARQLLGDLAEAHLIEPVTRDRYRCHDLLHAYADDRAHRDERWEDREHAVQALLNWYAYNAATADRLLFPAYVHRCGDLDKPPGALPAMSGCADALTWLDAERANLIAAIRHAVDHGLSHRATDLVHAIETFLYHRAHWCDLFEICALGTAAAQRTGDRASEAWFLIREGWALLQVSGWQAAVADLRRALALARELDDPYLQAYALNDLGMSCLRRDDYAEALDYLRPALRLSRGTDSGRQEAFVHSNISRALTGLGHCDRALEHAERSLVLRRQAADREGEVFTLNQLALVWQCLDAHPKAIAVCEEALRIRREDTYLPDIATTLDILGTSLRHTGNTERARTCWLEALTILDRFADQRAAELRTRLRALRTAD
jgi:tetratricopeptide (TPR) repeat protein